MVDHEMVLLTIYRRYEGYIGNAATLETCEKAIREIKERNKSVIYGKPWMRPLRTF